MSDINELLGLLDAVVNDDGKADVNGAKKRLIITRAGETVLRQEAIDGLLRAKVQAKRMAALAKALEEMAIEALKAGAKMQDGSHAVELDERETTSTSSAKALDALLALAGIDLDRKTWMAQEGFQEKRKKEVLRIDGRLQ